MSKNAASEEKLGRLHAILADKLIEQLEGKPVLGDDGEILYYEIDPRVLSSAITFLNNNKIVANPFLDEKISQIEERLRQRKTRFKAVDGGAKEAAKRAANAI